MGIPIEADSTGNATAITGQSAGSGDGVFGHSNTGIGVHGVNGQGSAPDGPGGPGVEATVCGVFGESDTSEGVFGASATQHGVHGVNGKGSGSKPSLGCGVLGDSESGYGVYAASKTASGVFGTSGAGHLAGEFVGDVSVSGTFKAQDVSVSGNVTAQDVILAGADCAEEFDIARSGQLEPGTVVVFDSEDAVSQSTDAYNKRVAGVISGAGTYRPGVVLGRDGLSEGKAPVALMGRVYCKVDADASPIALGDLLTTSDTPGHAMKVMDPLKGFGSIIGKALRPLASGRSLLPILISLQ